jgi:hypothetical protein
MFVLTTEGYVNCLNPNIRMYKYKAICGDIYTEEKRNPHICIDLGLETCYDITFLSGMHLTMSDKLEIMGKNGEFYSVDALKFGVKIALARTPNEVIEKNKHKYIYIQLVKELLAIIKQSGSIRRLNQDAFYCDFVVEWDKEKIDTFVISLDNIGIYIKVKKVLREEKAKFLLTADSEALNSLSDFMKDNSMEREIMDNENILKMNIDRERDFIQIVKDVKKIEEPTLFLKNKSGIDSWDSIVLDGVIVRTMKE